MDLQCAFVSTNKSFEFLFLLKVQMRLLRNEYLLIKMHIPRELVLYNFWTFSNQRIRKENKRLENLELKWK